MKRMMFWLSLPLAIGQAGHAFAQGPADALRYSQLQFGGPARTQGIAGANVALGADFGNVTSNPAGLGLYQRSEVQFSPGLGLGQGDGQLLGGGTAPQTENKNSFHIANAGLVIATRRADNDNGGDWRGGAFALGFTRLADFNSASRYQGSVADNASFFQRLREPRTRILGTDGILDQYNKADQNNGGYATLDGLAYGALLTDTVNTRGVSSIRTLTRRGPISQGEVLINSGSVSQFDLAYGASYRDRLYLGAGLGIVASNYRSARTFTETEGDASTVFEGLTLQDELKTSASGINFRAGLIYRATDAVRVGASVQTPTWLRMTDTQNTSLTSNFDPNNPSNSQRISSETATASTYQYAYTMTTPFRANGGVAVTLSKYGFLTGDVEYVGYKQARLHNDSGNSLGDNYSFADENAQIQQLYKNTVNLRFGAEGRYDIFRFRLGYARYGDPFQDQTYNRAQNFYTAGLGLRQNNFFLDVAGVYTQFNRYYSPYTIASNQQPVVQVKNDRYTTTVTAGLTF